MQNSIGFIFDDKVEKPEYTEQIQWESYRRS
jgi:hypothetical protein